MKNRLFIVLLGISVFGGASLYSSDNDFRKDKLESAQEKYDTSYVGMLNKQFEKVIDESEIVGAAASVGLGIAITAIYLKAWLDGNLTAQNVLSANALKAYCACAALGALGGIAALLIEEE